MEAVFWLSFGLVLYVYAGYPALLGLLGRIRPRPCRAFGSGELPSVSIVVAARNEAARLPGRLENLRSLDYPADRLEIIVVSNGSTDRTAAVVAAAAPGAVPVRLIDIAMPGKAAALNAGVAAARHDVLVFADARQRFAHDAVRRLVGNFMDPSVGAVSGELVLDCEIGRGDSTIADGVGMYWRYEKWLRKAESRIGSTIGATGAIYAMRRRYWRDLPIGTVLDDVLAPMRVVLAGARVIFDGTARAFDSAPPDAAAESERKSRTLAGNYQLTLLEPRLLIPIVNPVWWQFWSHKIGRLIVPFALVALFVTSARLTQEHPFYLLAALSQVLFYGLALYGQRLERLERRHLETTAPQHQRQAQRGAVNA